MRAGANTRGKTKCQALIRAGLGDLVYFSRDAEYNGTITTYYAADVQDVKPSCIFKPKTAVDVSKAIKVLNSQEGKNFPVAIRSGGHAPYASNNIKDGVVIDLSRLNSVTHKPCNGKPGIVSVGTGARWGEVYNTIQAQGIMVAGARENRVGLGGFMLGGGFSWYSGYRGICADNVVAYEIVLADGTITSVTASNKPDLFRALKGGLNNLGIVTRFDIQAFAAKDVYGGLVAYPWSQANTIVDIFVEMTDNIAKNRAESGFVALSWGPDVGSSVVFITGQVDGEANTPMAKKLTDLKPLLDIRAKQPLTNLTAQVASTSGLYNIWYTLSTQNTRDMARKVVSVFEKHVAALEKLNIVEPIRFIIVYTPVPKVFGTNKNILGLDNLKTNTMVLQPEALFPTKKWESLVQGKLRDATAEIDAYAKKTKQDAPFLYINYANPEQNPLRGYGKENGMFLAKAAKKWDSEGYFQRKNVAGEFKLDDL